MTTPKYIEQSRDAMDRSMSQNHKSLAVFDSSQKMITESIRLMETMRSPTPGYRLVTK
ncbi:hypothetical protein [Roseobacter sp.]|uniref:hypothetical protein n=1 Tax=Roseobacter sp. TaxID=1907202 RepID=UPI003298F91D